MVSIKEIISLLVSIFLCICWWKIYVKMGFKGWICLIPVYSQHVFYKAIWGKSWPLWGPILTYVGVTVLRSIYAVVGISSLLGGSQSFVVNLVITLIFKGLSLIALLFILVISFITMFKMYRRFNHGVGTSVFFTLLPIVGIPVCASYTSDFI